MTTRVLKVKGLKFDGIDDYVNCGNSSSLDLTTVTIAFWMRKLIYVIPTWNNVIGKASSPFANWDNGSYVIRLLNYDITSGMWCEDGTQSYLRYPLTWDATWTHIAVVFASNSHHSLYVNGVRVAHNIVNKIMRRNNYCLWIGGYRFCNIIDEVMVFNRALSNTEIMDLYNGKIIKDGLVLYYDFSEGGGNILYDKSGYGNHGTIYGARWLVKKV